MDPSNPYEPSSSMLAGEANEGDTLAPVPIEAGAILRRCWELFQRNPGVVIGAVFILPFMVQNVRRFHSQENA